MTRKPSVHTCLLALCAVVLPACKGADNEQWRTVRLGRDTVRLEIAREVRTALPSSETTVIEVPNIAGCRVRTAIANLDRDVRIAYKVTGVFENGRELPLFESVEPATYGWKDVEFDLGGSSPTSLRFSSATKGHWAQPIAHCRRDVERRHPNVILVSLDTLRADRLAAYGSTKHITPRLDKIVRNGTAFEQTYAQFPNTYGSHATMFTGLFPRQHGLISGRDARITPGSSTLAAAFAAVGYRTVAFTENAFVGSAYGFDVGFDSFHNGPIGNAFEMFPGEAQVTFGRAVAWLRERPPGPFFMFLHSYEVHSPYEPPHGLASLGLKIRFNPNYMGRFHAMFSPIDQFAHNAGVAPLEPADIRQAETLYDIETLQLDGYVGTLMDALTELDLLRNTLLVITADHGEEFGEHRLIGHGENLHQRTMHVPLVFHMPGTVPSGKRVAHPVGLIDLGPTVASLAGIGAIMTGTPATDRSTLVLGTQPSTDGLVMSELNQNVTSCSSGIRREPTLGFSDTPCPYDGVAVRDSRYTYIEEKGLGTRLFFDRSVDPEELVNIADGNAALVATFAQAAAEYRSRYRERVLETAPTEVDPMTHEKLRALGYIQ